MSLGPDLLQPENNHAVHCLPGQSRRLAGDIFLEALEVGASGRAQLLKQVCGSNSQVRSEVESLLRDADRGDVFLPSTLTLSGFRVGDLMGAHGRFRIARWIGTGGMGEVYEAQDLDLDKSIAIKTIRPEVAERPEMIARFKREIQIGQEVTHSNVCRVYDLGKHWVPSPSGELTTCFMTMELLGNAQTLFALLKERGSFPLREVIRVGATDRMRHTGASRRGLCSSGSEAGQHHDCRPGVVAKLPGRGYGPGSRQKHLGGAHDLFATLRPSSAQDRR
jgi:hypothetical protein